MKNIDNPLLHILRILTLQKLDVTLRYSEEQESYYIDLNTLTKSNLYLFDNGDLKGRYNYVTKVDLTLNDNNILRTLCLEFIHSMYGRDYCSSEWLEVCKKLNLKITK